MRKSVLKNPLNCKGLLISLFFFEPFSYAFMKEGKSKLNAFLIINQNNYIFYPNYSKFTFEKKKLSTLAWINCDGQKKVVEKEKKGGKI